MAVDLIKAAGDARRLLRGFQAFAEVAAALDAVGQLEQRQAEAEAALIRLGSEHEAAQAALGDARTEAGAIQARAKADADSIKARADKILAAADDKLGAAARAAEALRADAQVKHADALENVRRLTVDATAQRNKLLAECADLETRLAKAQASINVLLKA